MTQELLHQQALNLLSLLPDEIKDKAVALIKKNRDWCSFEGTIYQIIPSKRPSIVRDGLCIWYNFNLDHIDFMMIPYKGKNSNRIGLYYDHIVERDENGVHVRPNRSVIKGEDGRYRWKN